MQRLLMAMSASVAFAALSGPARADDTTLVIQQGYRNSATATQANGAANNRYVDIRQIGDNYTANATQSSGSSGGRIYIDQTTLSAGMSADKSAVRADQSDGSVDSLIIVNQSAPYQGEVDGPTATIVQGRGKQNEARLTQNAVLSEGRIYQEGDNNRAFGSQGTRNAVAPLATLRIEQTGAGKNYIDARQDRGHSYASVDQKGAGSNVAVTKQSSDISTLEIIQDGYHNTAYVTQNFGAMFSSSIVEQRGNNGYISIDQSGGTSNADVRQFRGSSNSRIQATQNGNINTVRLRQYVGSDNVIFTEQIGTGSLMDVSQAGDRNYASLRSTGSGFNDNAFIVQNGNNNRVTGFQTGSSPDGGGNIATVTQNGNNNAASFSQTGGFNSATINQ